MADVSLSSIVVEVVKIVVPSAIAICGFLVASHTAGFREYQKISIARIDVASEMLDDIVCEYFDFMNQSQFDQAKSMKIQLALASMNRELASLKLTGVLDDLYVKHWNRLKGMIALRNLDLTNFKSGRSENREEVLVAVKEFGTYLSEMKVNNLNKRRTLVDSVLDRRYF